MEEKRRKLRKWEQEKVVGNKLNMNSSFQRGKTTNNRGGQSCFVQKGGWNTYNEAVCRSRWEITLRHTEKTDFINKTNLIRTKTSTKWRQDLTWRQEEKGKGDCWWRTQSHDKGDFPIILSDNLFLFNEIHVFRSLRRTGRKAARVVLTPGSASRGLRSLLRRRWRGLQLLRPVRATAEARQRRKIRRRRRKWTSSLR